MVEIITTALGVFALIVLLVLWEAPGILAVLAVGFVAVLLSLAERISGAPPGSYLRAMEDELSARRQLHEQTGEGDGDDDD
ncbi:MAG TPA: hypothetical protein VGC13_24375 [Longimicrobium sp.]|jgi:UPF0716 family protein affecting phage T7 exclusion|uniref:hypothetical protein n=1 Tax=Longimicrobium sp. TaxID=2029185 RepID=UPI002EDA723D